MRRRYPPEGFQSLIVEDPTERDQHRNMSGRSDEVTKTSYRPAYNYHHVIGFRNWPICIVRRREPPGAVLTERYTCVWTLGKRSTLLIDFIEDCGPSYRQSRGQLIEVYRPQNKPYRASRSPWRTDIPSASLRLEHAYGDRKTCGTLVEDVKIYTGSERDGSKRRGYLLQGAPATGKTTSALVIATETQVPLYRINLQDSSMTDHELRDLFRALPLRCVVLADDVQSAWLRKGDATHPGVKADQGSFAGDLGVSQACLLEVMGWRGDDLRILIFTTNYTGICDGPLIQ